MVFEGLLRFQAVNRNVYVLPGLAVEPEVLLLDEPCSALDPISTAKTEETIWNLRDECTIVIVTPQSATGGSAGRLYSLP